MVTGMVNKRLVFADETWIKLGKNRQGIFRGHILGHQFWGEKGRQSTSSTAARGRKVDHGMIAYSKDKKKGSHALDDDGDDDDDQPPNS